MAQRPTIDRLLNLVPDTPNIVLEHLRAHPELASQQDTHGYSLVHAATSYGHIDLLKALVNEFHVGPNITDEDDETALFNAESVEMAKELLALGVKTELKNNEGQTAEEKLDDEDEQPLVAAFLREAAGRSTSEAAASVLAQTGGVESSSSTAENGTLPAGDHASNGVHPPPPLPNGVEINVGTMQESEAGDEPDPEFRRRIEELAAREDFQGEESQRELRNLVTDALSGYRTQDGQGAASKRRLG